MKIVIIKVAVIIVCLGNIAGSQTAGTQPILSEFVCNPAGDLETEWIELYNPSGFAVDLSRYQIGDALGLRDISDTGMYLMPGEYIVLTEDPGRFLIYYDDFEGILASPSGWQILNNYGGEVIRLANDEDETIDSVYYDAGYPDNRSCERYVNPEGESFWGESFSPTGSTPGKPNTFFYPRAGSMALTITPDPFSPDGDGFEDVTVISYNMPESDEFELAVYDIAGRKVKTFFESGASIPGEIEWDGRGDDGRALAVGIYIVYARVGGGISMETKKTVVIAHR
jgi:hypothetical protein